MHEIIELRRKAEKIERYDILSSLLDANSNSTDNESALSDQELIGT